MLAQQWVQTDKNLIDESDWALGVLVQHVEQQPVYELWLNLRFSKDDHEKLNVLDFHKLEIKPLPPLYIGGQHKRSAGYVFPSIEHPLHNADTVWRSLALAHHSKRADAAVVDIDWA